MCAPTASLPFSSTVLMTNNNRANVLLVIKKVEI